MAYNVRFEDMYNLSEPPETIVEDFLRFCYTNIIDSLGITNIFLMNNKDLLSQKIYTSSPFVVIQHGNTNFSNNFKMEPVNGLINVISNRIQLGFSYFDVEMKNIDIFFEEFPKIFAKNSFNSQIDDYRNYFTDLKFTKSFRLSLESNSRLLQMLYIELDLLYDTIYDPKLPIRTIESFNIDIFNDDGVEETIIIS